MTISTWRRLGGRSSSGSGKPTNNGWKTAITPARAATLIGAWQKINQVFGLYTKQEKESGRKAGPRTCRSSWTTAQAARKAKDFKRSDAIRDELKAKGWAIEDTPKGPRLKRLCPEPSITPIRQRPMSPALLSLSDAIRNPHERPLHHL